MVKRTIVGAGYGLRDWLTQRLAALTTVLYTLFILIILCVIPHDHLAWKNLFDQLWFKIITQISVLAFSWSLWIEIRDTWMDYIKPVGWRVIAHFCTVLWLLSCFIYMATLIWQ